MKQQNLFEPVPTTKLSLMSREDLEQLFLLEQQVRVTFQNDNSRLRAQNKELEQKTLLVNEQYITLKNKFFGRSSEKSPSKEDRKKTRNNSKNKKKKVQLPSLRYPNAPLIERDVELKDLPQCKTCDSEMLDSGMTENSEYVTVIPAQYIVIRLKRHKYRCSCCHGDLITTPLPPRIKRGSSYSDEMLIDVAMSKYCDLVPVERYATIAGREGLKDLPPQSLIEGTHNLSDYIEGAYDKLKSEITSSQVLHADETPHKMLEQSGNKSWYLWGFSNKQASYFEIHDTRSGDVASEVLKKSKCEYLVSDVFSGYAKTVKVTNKYREKEKLIKMQNVYCNAHARRKFKESEKVFEDEAGYFIELYKKIYRLEKIAQKRPPDRVLRVRRIMKPLFEQMKLWCLENIAGYSTKSSLGKAMSYFLKNYKEFILFLENKDLPIDNNSQERLMRSPVIGRKTWYGTHSKRGAKTTAVLFSLVESCKLNNINPREYIKNLVQDLHDGKNPYTPSEFIELTKK